MSQARQCWDFGYQSTDITCNYNLTGAKDSNPHEDTGWKLERECFYKLTVERTHDGAFRKLWRGFLVVTSNQPVTRRREVQAKEWLRPGFTAFRPMFSRYECSCVWCFCDEHQRTPEDCFVALVRMANLHFHYRAICVQRLKCSSEM